MLFAIGLLIVIGYLSWRIAPRESEEDAHVHGAGQVGLLAALALFGVDYFTSYFYATGELMSALHPYGMQKYAYIAVAVIALANVVFGGLYIYSLGIFKQGGGSFAASMRYLGPSISLIVAVVLIQDYVLTIVVSSLSGVDQLLSIFDAYGVNWFWHFAIGALLALLTWYVTIRGRGESAQFVFMLLAVFVLLTVGMLIGLILAIRSGVPPAPAEVIKDVSLGQALFHMLTASMKGMVALTGLEAMSDGIQFVIDQDAGIVAWGKKRLPRLQKMWDFYSGKPGIGRIVQTSFIFYGGITTTFLTYFSIHFNVFDGTFGRTLVGNLAFIGFDQLPGGLLLYWAYQILAVLLLSAAALTAYQDIQAIAWRNVAIGEIPEYIVYRNPKGTFTRPVTAAFIATVVIQLLVRGETTLAVPFYGIGVFLPLTVMALAMREHVKRNVQGRARAWGMAATTFGVFLGITVFIGQIVGKWEEGGALALVAIIVLIIMAHFLLISPIGHRTPQDIHRIIRDKSRIEGQIGTMVEWQSLKVQEYRFTLLVLVTRFWALFGVHRPLRYEPPAAAGDYDEAMNTEYRHSFLHQYLESRPKKKPRLGGAPREAAPTDENE
jgi:hypothetical protein